ncbi:hypothetical protein B4U79_01822 [Dinothrombium tinctorium]|uniref:Uncharacterized protein n=1 Tax=Dinothrombium tinctorium TaxID=1965070 RepID=A0A3S4QFH4_9ACAR|nr:hypothetical protein B4U79_01822 [Dinothrombium tinctorium]
MVTTLRARIRFTTIILHHCFTRHVGQVEKVETECFQPQLALN